MPIIQTIQVYRGEDITINFTMSPPKDISGWVISFTVAKSWNSQNKLFQITATVTNGPAGEFSVIITSAQLNITPGTYVYDVFRVNPSNLRILSAGPFELIQDAKFPT